MPPHEQVVPRKPPLIMFPAPPSLLWQHHPTLTRPHQGGGDAPLRGNTLAGGPYCTIQVSFSPALAAARAEGRVRASGALRAMLTEPRGVGLRDPPRGTPAGSGGRAGLS